MREKKATRDAGGSLLSIYGAFLLTCDADLQLRQNLRLKYDPI